MMARFVWAISLLIIASITAGVQLDRQARKTPELAPYVPGVFRSASQPRIVILEARVGAQEVSLDEAQRLVRRRPMPARHLRLLAQAQFASGEAEAGGLSIQYAAQRGWRDALAQEAMMELALAAGDRSEAARRFAALFLKRGVQRELLERTGQRVFATPIGPERAVFAEIVRGGDRWHNAFLTRGARVIPEDAFVEILKLSTAAGAQFPCSALKQGQGIIANRDQIAGERASRILAKTC